MTSNRKYTEEEIVYVHARILAGWDFDVIARAFKAAFAPHWANKTVTRKQIQYIKTSYKRAPGSIQPYEGPIPSLSPSPSPPTAESITMDHKGSKHHASRDWTTSFTADADQKPTIHSSACIDIEGHTQHHTDQQFVAASDPESRGLQGSLSEQAGAIKYGASYPPSVTGYNAMAMDPRLSSFQAAHHKAGYQGAENHGVDSRFSGHASGLDTDSEVAIPALGSSILSSGVSSHVPNHDLLPQQQSQTLEGTSLLSLDWLSGSNIPPTVPQARPAATGAAPQQGPSGCTVDRMAYYDHKGWWYLEAHDRWCRIAHEHRHDYDGSISFRDMKGYSSSLCTEINELLVPWGLKYDRGSDEIVRQSQERGQN